MKKIILCLALFVLLLQAPANAMGLFYTDTTYPLLATGVKSTKDISCLAKGTASALNVLFIVQVGDAGLSAASRDGNIKQVYFADVNEQSVFIFFKRITTTVYGE